MLYKRVGTAEIGKFYKQLDNEKVDFINGGLRPKGYLIYRRQITEIFQTLKSCSLGIILNQAVLFYLKILPKPFSKKF